MLRFSANLSFLYQEHDFADRFAAAARDGFAGVEYIAPYGEPKERVAALLAEHRLEQVLFNLPVGDWQAGERGTACFPDRVEEFRRGVILGIEYATALGCPRVNVLAGRPPPGADRAMLEATLVANLRYAAPRCADAGVKLLIEAINTRDMPGFFLPTVEDAERVIDKVGSDNLWIQYDIYHRQVMRGDIMPTFARLQSRIAHIQVADHPGRHEPGTGEINYGFVLAELDRLGYDGWIGCEYRPATTTTAGLGWLAEWRTQR